MDEKKSPLPRGASVVATTTSPFHAEPTGTARRRPAPLSYEEVAQAADAIEASGEKVTIARVRQQVGGAAETVTSFLGRWREARRIARTGGDGLPESLRVALLREFALQREAAKGEMQEQLTEQREAASELDAELRRARESIATHMQAIAALQEQLHKTNEKVAENEHAAELLRTKMAAEGQALLSQQQGAQEKLAQALEELGQTRCRAEVEAGRAKTLVAENERLRAELTQSARKADDAGQKAAAAEQRAAVAAAKLDGQGELLTIAREQNQQDRRRIDELLMEAKNSHQRAHTAEQTQKQLRHKLDAAHAEPASKDKKP